MNTITIDNVAIGDGKKTFIIAEGCDNHMGNMETAREMCRLAKLAGADCIKFQHHLPDEEMLKDVPMSSNFDIPLYDFLKQHALTLDQHVELMNYCKEIGIIYLCTPFSLKAAYELNEIGVPAFKIGSGEMTDIPTLQKISQLGKPMIVLQVCQLWRKLREPMMYLLKPEWSSRLRIACQSIRQNMKMLT